MSANQTQEGGRGRALARCPVAALSTHHKNPRELSELSAAAHHKDTDVPDIRTPEPKEKTLTMLKRSSSAPPSVLYVKPFYYRIRHSWSLTSLARLWNEEYPDEALEID